MYKNCKIQTTTIFFMRGVLMWLLYGGHYKEMAFAQGGEVQPTLAAEAEPTATAEAEPSEVPSETAVEDS
ncbi:MAG: hypothetical protein ACPGWR_04985 [Ardenticatenaceae bacterium]